MSSFDLSGRRALVTGSTRGIGLEIASGLARAGAAVVFHGRERERAEQVASSVSAVLAAEGNAPSVYATAFDVTDPSSMLSAVDHLEAEIGGIDILVNNAGIQLRRALIDLPLASWQRVLDADLTSCFVLAQALARGMLTRRSGKIINICSVQSAAPRATTAPYAVAKAGLANLGRAMCTEWAASGIQANGLAPGYIVTEMNTALVDDPELSAWVVGRTPARRWGTVADLVGPAVWLASSASDFVNGQVIYVDGGLTASL